jgi:hypothetical protein
VLPLLPPTPVRQAESAMAAVTVPLHKKGGKVEEGWQEWVGPRAYGCSLRPRGTPSMTACASRTLLLLNLLWTW